MSTYVYGIADRSHPAPAEGTTGVGEPARPVRTVVGGDLAAVVSDAPPGLRPLRRDLLAHQSVLRRVGARGPVLPLRFGSVAPDDDAVRKVLVERGAHFHERLRALAGKVEYRVRAVHDERAVLRRVMADHPEIRAMSETADAAGRRRDEQRRRLGERVRAAVRDREAEDARAVYGALAPASAAVQGGPGPTAALVDLSFLVAEDAADAFRAAVGRMRRQLGHLRMDVTGPCPPYSFVEPGPAQSAVPGGPRPGRPLGTGERPAAPADPGLTDPV